MKSKDHKIVFNLSIKDLKELGILDKKKKKKKRRKSKYSKKKGLNNFGEGYRTENLSRGETFLLYIIPYWDLFCVEAFFFFFFHVFFLSPF
jgi:hypothetical protein